MSVHPSRRNIMRTSAYMEPIAPYRWVPIDKQPTHPTDPRVKIFRHQHPDIVIPYHNAYTTVSPREYERQMYGSTMSVYDVPVPTNGARVSPTNFNGPIDRETRMLLERNKNMENPLNNSPFYDPLDPSTMWMPQNHYYNPNN